MVKSTGEGRGGESNSARCATIGCRLCPGIATWAFSTLILGKHEIGFYVCRDCGSLQAQEPYWLAESYSTTHGSIDPGSARRTLDCFALVHAVARLFKCRTTLDFGGNTGLLCRLLRDRGHDAYTYDPHVTAMYAPQFIGTPSDSFDLVSAFEVIEHFSHPAKDLERIFGARPRVVIASTELYAGQNAEWWYLTPQEGQHVFFYTERAINLIAARYQYEVLIGKSFFLFSRNPLSSLQRLVLSRFLRPRILRIAGAISLMGRARGAEKDYIALTSGNRSGGGS